jgi:sulfoxide reductase catalytic subunit YedY
MISFDAAHRAVHYPPDRRFRIWIRPSILIGTAIVVLGLIAASWIQVAVAGLPQIPALSSDFRQQLGRKRASGG